MWIHRIISDSETTELILAILCDIITRVLSVTHRMYMDSTLISRDMDGWMVSESLVLQDLMTFISNLLMQMKQFLQKFPHFDIAAQGFCAILGQCWSDNAPLSIAEVIFQMVSTRLFLWINCIHCYKNLFGREHFLSSSLPRSFTENRILILLGGNKLCSSDILFWGT